MLKKISSALAALIVAAGVGAVAAPAQAAGAPYHVHFSKTEVQRMKKSYDTSTGAGCSILVGIVGKGNPIGLWACKGPANTIKWVDKAYYKGCGLDASYTDGGGYSYQGRYTYALSC